MIDFDTTPSPVLDYVLGELRSNAKLPFVELRERAQLNNLVVTPLVYGRARALLGLLPDNGDSEVEPAPRVSAVPEASAEAAPRELPRRGHRRSNEKQFLLGFLNRQPDATLEEAQAAAAKDFLTISPAVWSSVRPKVERPARRRVTPQRRRSRSQAAEQMSSVDALHRLVRERQEELVLLERAMRELVVVLSRALQE